MKKFIFSKVEGIKPATFRDEPKEEKNLLKRTSKGSKATKQLGGLGGHFKSPPPSHFDFHDFHMPREAISDLFSS